MSLRSSRTCAGALASSSRTGADMTNRNRRLRTSSKNSRLARSNSGSKTPPKTDVSAYTRMDVIRMGISQALVSGMVTPAHMARKVRAGCRGIAVAC